MRKGACPFVKLKVWETMARVARTRGERSPGLKPLADGWLGEALARQNRFQEAEPILRAALNLLPGDAMLAENLRQAERYANPSAKARKSAR